MGIELVIYVSRKKWIAFKAQDIGAAASEVSWCIDNSRKQENELIEQLHLAQQNSYKLRLIVGPQTTEDEVKYIQETLLTNELLDQQNIIVSYILDLLGETLIDKGIDPLEPGLYFELINDTLEISLLKKRVVRKKNVHNDDVMRKVSSILGYTVVLQPDTIKAQIQDVLGKIYEEAYLRGIAEEEVKSIVVVGVSTCIDMDELVEGLPANIKCYIARINEVVKYQLQMANDHKDSQVLNEGICIKSYNKQIGQLEYPQVFDIATLKEEMAQKTFWLTGSYYNQQTIELEFYTSINHSKIGSIKFPFQPTTEQGVGRFKVDIILHDKRELVITIYDMYQDKQAVQTILALA